METVTSADGTTIACEVTGDGPALILTGGALTARSGLRTLAAELEDVRVINFDRRGRGDSGDTSVDPDREIEDIAALIELAGGSASLYGHSSGAGVTLRAAAAAAGLDVDRLILHEPPYVPDDEPAGGEVPRSYSRELTAILADGRPADAVELFLTRVGMPPEMIQGMKEGPDWESYVAIGPSLAWDSAAMGDSTGGLIPHELIARVRTPTLVLEGTETLPFMIEAGEAIADELPNGALMMLEGMHHEPDPVILAPILADFATS